MSGMNDLSALLQELREKDVFLSLQDGNLGFDAPPGVMTGRLLDDIRANKQALIDHLEAEALLDLARAKAPQPRSQQSRIPLSREQQRMWFLSLLEGENSYAYNMPPVVLELEGNLNLPALEEAFNRLIDRHEILRTTFATDDTGPIQKILSAQRLVIESESLGRLSLEQEIRREASFPFSLSGSSPLFRVRLFAIGDKKHVFCLTIHHIICDGWSIGILVEELARFYLEADQGKHSEQSPLSIQYADFAIWQQDWLQSSEAIKAREFWKNCLAAPPPPMELPHDLIRSGVSGFRGVTRFYTVPAGLSSDITQRCRKEGWTPFMFFLTAFHLLLIRLTGSLDQIIGIPVSARPHPALEPLIGLFLNTIPLRLNMPVDSRSTKLVDYVKDSFLAAFEHSHLPLDEILKSANWERRGSEKNPFQSLFAFQNAPLGEASLGQVKITPLPTENLNAVVDLIMSVEEVEGSFEVKMRGASELFEPGSIDRLLQQFSGVLEELLDGNGLTIDGVSRPAGGFQTPHAKPSSEFVIDETLWQRFERTAQQFPDKEAVQFEQSAATYRELYARATELAGRISRYVEKAGDPIGIFLPRSADWVVAIMAVLKTGGAYVPLDPDSASERIGLILEDCGARAVVTSQDAGRLGVINSSIDQIDVTERGGSSDLAAITSDAETVAYIIYTSGSTGRPKGVRVAHSNVLRLLDCTQGQFGFGPADTWTLFHSPAFDFSVWEIFGALLTGGTLIVVPWAVSRDPRRFYELVCEKNVSVLNQTPSAFLRFAAESELASGQDSLKWVIFGGEALDLSTLRPWAAKRGLKNPTLVNMYGITETTVHTTLRVLDKEDIEGSRKSRIGRPLSDLGIILVDADMYPVMPGAVGEIVVTGAGVANGYLNRPELTAEKFPEASEFPALKQLGLAGRVYRSGDLARWVSDADLEYCGRADHQIKIHGYRIEPGEVEAAINDDLGVEQSLVQLYEDEQSIPGLVAYYVVRAGYSVDPDQLRSRLLARLPKYMTPSRFIPLKSFPLTINGKIDRKELPSPLAHIETSANSANLPSSSVLSPETSEIGKLVSGIWSDILGIGNLGAQSDFFELGGDSVRAAMAVNKLQDALKEVIYVAGIFEHPRLGDYIRYLETEYSVVTPESSAGVSDLQSDIVTFDRILKQANFRFEILEKKNPRAIFVLSPPRSGSTLLRVLLGGHPELFSPPELELIRYQSMRQRQDAFEGALGFYLEGLTRALMELNHWDQEQAQTWVDATIRENRSTHWVFGELQRLAKPKVLVDKTPSYALDMSALSRIESGFERPFYIHLYRHPCGMINSFVKARLDQIFFRHDHSFKTAMLAELIWLRSHQNIAASLQEVSEDRQTAISFESLVSDPENELRRLCDEIGIGFSSSMLDLYGDSKSRMTDGVKAESRMIGDIRFHDHREINQAVSNAWQEQFSIKQLAPQTRAHWDQLRDDANVSSPEGNPRGPWLPSLSQERLWFLDQLEDSASAYTIPGAVELSGSLNREALIEALEALTDRHLVLRSRLVSDSGVVTVDVSQPWLGFWEEDLTHLTDAQKDQRVQEVLATNAGHHFALNEGGLFRAGLVKLADDRYIFLVNLHHIVCDGWSVPIIFRELTALYNARLKNISADLPYLERSFGDYAQWQRARLGKTAVRDQLVYWKQKLANLPPPLELPLIGQRSTVQTFRGGRLEFTFPREVTDRIRSYCRAQRCTVFMFLLANFAVMLSQVSATRDLTIGTPVRSRLRQEFEKLVGFFANTLVLRIDLKKASFVELLASVRTTVIEALANEEVPFEQVVSEVQPERNLGLSPLFQTFFSLQRKDPQILLFDGIDAQMLDTASPSAKFDLSLLFDEYESELHGSFEFNADLLSDARVEMFRAHFSNLVLSHLEEGNSIARSFRSLGQQEQKFILNSAVEKSTVPSDRTTLWDWVNAGFSETPPSSIAVRRGSEELSYQALKQLSSRIGERLIAQGVRRGDRIGVCLDRDLRLIPALVGVLSVGACYVPIDASFPDSRIEFMLDQASVSVVLLSPNVQDRSCFKNRRQFNWGLESSPGADVQSFGPNPNDTAYICFTSGSTGNPKGVAISHASAANLLSGMQQLLKLDASDVWAAITTISFDIHVPELFLLLGVGGCIELLNEPESRDPHLLTNILDSSGASVFQATPSTWRVLEVTGWKGRSQLVGLSGGEKLGADLARYLQTRLKALWNFYGPTETTVWSAAAQITPHQQQGLVPIGRPILNNHLVILDQEGELAPLGVWGELGIGGIGLTAGYLNQPDLTSTRFRIIDLGGVPTRVYRTGDRARLLSDGSFEVSGRLDNQVKVRGVRIEPEEIEATLETHPGVQSAVVSVREIRGEQVLVATVSGDLTAQEKWAGALSAFVRDRLPSTMTPGIWHSMPSLPVMASGKIDRQAVQNRLSQLDVDQSPDSRTGPAPLAGKDLIELRLGQLWADYLPVQTLDRNANFFSIGGHSLLAVRLLAAVEREFNRQIPLATLFQAPTIALMSEFLRKADSSQDVWSAAVRMKKGDEPKAVFLIPGAGGNVLYFQDLVQQVPQTYNVYGLQPPGLDGRTPPIDRIPTLARYFLDQVSDIVRSEDLSDIVVLGHSFGGLVAYELARLAQIEGPRLRMVGILDTAAPQLQEQVGRDWSHREWVLHLSQIASHMFNADVTLTASMLESDSEIDQIQIFYERLVSSGVVPEGTRLEFVSGLIKVYRSNLAASTDLSPPEKAIENLILIRSRDEQPQNLITDAAARNRTFVDLGWADFLGHSIDVLECPGDHLTMLQDKNTDKLWQGLSDRLN